MDNDKLSQDALREELREEVVRILGYSLSNIPININSEQTAKVLDISPGTLAVWRSTGRYNLKYIKIGRHAKYPVLGIIDFMIRRTRTHTGQMEVHSDYT